MKTLFSAIFAVIILAAAALRADVTIRYKIDFQPEVSHSRGVSDARAKADDENSSFILRMKGNKGRVTSDGLTMLLDFVTQEVTVFDTEHRNYAVIPASEYAGQMASAMAGIGPGFESFGGMKTAVTTKAIARAMTIRGIQAEGREIVFTMEPPESADPLPSELRMKIVMQIWTAKAAEAVRLPAIRELAGFQLWQKLFMDPAAMLGPMSPKTSDTANAIEALFAEIGRSQSVILRMHTEMFMPGALAQAAGQTGLPGQSGQPAAAPFFQMTQELSELSTTPVQEGEFQVPADYTSAPAERVIAAAFHVKPPAKSEAAPASQPRNPGAVEAYIPMLTPLHQAEPDASQTGGAQGMVELLVTVDPLGNVTQAEALTGPEVLRKPALDAVKQWTFRPVLRDGRPVAAYTNATVDFVDWSKGARGGSMPSVEESMASMRRWSGLEAEFPRSPQQVLADFEQDSGGDDPMRRFYALDQMATAALAAGAEEKAAGYAQEVLRLAKQNQQDWNYGNAIHDGHMVLGLVAMRHGDVASARQQLLEAGKSSGSPQLDSFGPNMALAKELTEKGERDTVLQYFAECRSFWKTGVSRLDAWSETVRKGGTPVFGANLR